MERTAFATLTDMPLIIREANKSTKSERDAWNHGYLLLVNGANGKVVGQIKQDDLFDADGNRFDFE
jgi:hypothetical protein